MTVHKNTLYYCKTCGVVDIEPCEHDTNDIAGWLSSDGS